MKDLEEDPTKIDYDVVVEVYQNFIMKEREAIEEQKMRDVKLLEKVASAAEERILDHQTLMHDIVHHEDHTELKGKFGKSNRKNTQTKVFPKTPSTKMEKFEQKDGAEIFIG